MVHARNDFMLLTLDQLVNNASKWRYGGGHSHVPITIRGIVGRGWGQGPQHSQSLQATFAHFPGLKVVMPATPHDAKGLMIGSIRDNSPVIFIEHRRCYDQVGPVPENYYEEPLGKAVVRLKGKDVTIVATSLMVSESLKAAESLLKQGISIEVVDLRTVKPMDEETILESVRRTGRLIVADTSWQSFGVGSEIISRVTTKIFSCLKAAPRLVASPDAPSPTSFALERLFYPGPDEITVAVLETIKGKPVSCPSPGKSGRPIDEDFRGPF
jgi:pyruvate dehydrogenase E1 component beta subunit